MDQRKGIGRPQRLIRPLLAGEVREALSLLGEIYDLGSGDAYAAEYPTVYGPESRATVWGIVEGGRLLTTAAALPGHLALGDAALGFARVGSVATAPEARGQGLAAQILDAIHGALAAEGQAVVGLWAQKGGVYARAGYVPVGASFVVPWRPRRPPPFRPGLQIAHQRAPLAPWALTLDHDFGPELAREPWELARLLSIAPMEVALGRRSGDVVAWACLGRGQDMGGIVHDFGGDTEDVMALLHRLLVGGSGAVLCPAHHPLLAALDPEGEATPTLWLKILDRGALLTWAEALGVAEGLEALEDADLLWALFGRPPTPRDLRPPPGRLPFFVWGLDSI